MNKRFFFKLQIGDARIKVFESGDGNYLAMLFLQVDVGHDSRAYNHGDNPVMALQGCLHKAQKTGKIDAQPTEYQQDYEKVKNIIEHGFWQERS